jgi:hypothetical protein
MAKKSLRTVKKSSQTGRLDRDDVRSAVINARDERIGQQNGRGNAGSAIQGACGKQRNPAGSGLKQSA